MGLPTTSSAQQVADFISTHNKLAAQTIHSEGTEFFKVIGNSLHGGRFGWTQQPHAILPDHKIAICRHKQAGIYRYFSGEIRRETVIAEAPIEQVLPRLMFALGKDLSIPVQVTTQQNGEFIQIRVSERLPTEEYRLALLLAANISRFGNATSYSVKTSLAPALLENLSYLGCSLRISN